MKLNLEKCIDMKKFEYHVLQYSKGINSESAEINYKDLEQLGNEGWELCGCVVLNGWIIYYFKREIEQEFETTYTTDRNYIKVNGNKNL